MTSGWSLGNFESPWSPQLRVEKLKNRSSKTLELHFTCGVNEIEYVNDLSHSVVMVNSQERPNFYDRIDHHYLRLPVFKNHLAPS